MPLLLLCVFLTGALIVIITIDGLNSFISMLQAHDVKDYVQSCRFSRRYIIIPSSLAISTVAKISLLYKIFATFVFTTWVTFFRNLSFEDKVYRKLRF